MGKSYYLTGGRTGIARRISWEEPSLTLTTSPMQKQTERCHPEQTRPFTVREYARIQSFPDDWEFMGSLASDTDLLEHVQNTVNMFSSQLDLKKFNKNIIDPIKLTFDSKIYKKTIEEILQSEVLRQIDKSNNNQIGYFHQNIFKYIGGDDWVVPTKGFDIINEKKKIYVEMKNKHNTMNSSSSNTSYGNMEKQIDTDPDSTCLLVEVIAKQSQNIPWKPPSSGKSIQNEKIRRISIDKFYEMVTGDPLSFYKLCVALPKVLDDIIENSANTIITDTVLQELQSNYKSKDLFNSLYLLAFDKYEGFNSLK